MTAQGQILDTVDNWQASAGKTIASYEQQLKEYVQLAP